MMVADPQHAAATFVGLQRHGTSPARTGAAFIQSIAVRQVPPSAAVCWYLGQASVVCKGGSRTAWIDPYLAPHPARRYPPFCQPEDVVGADLVLITHEHSDHLDPFTCRGIATSSPQAIFVCPPACATAMQAAGIPPSRLRTPATGEVLDLGNWRIWPLPAAHEHVEVVPGLGHRFTGYMLEVDGVVIYHAGDTVACDALAAALLPWVERVDLALLPINGADYFRRSNNVLGNFSFREAAELAMRLGPALTAPIHYDLFAGHNDECPGYFVNYVHDRAPYLPIAVPAPGQSLVISAR